MAVPLHVNLFKGHLDFLTLWRMSFKREHPKRSRWKCMVFLGLSFRSPTVSLLLYFICPGSHKGQPSFKGIGHRFYLLLEELQHATRAHGMRNIVADRVFQVCSLATIIHIPLICKIHPSKISQNFYPITGLGSVPRHRILLS